MTAIEWASASELAREVSGRRLSPVEIAETLLARIEAVNGGINAFVHMNADLVRRRARELEAAVMRGEALGALHGVPYSIKDLTAVAGLPLTLGLVPFRDNVAHSSAVIVQRLEGAGGLLLGKTNTPEVGYYGATDNHLFGPTRNPWNRQRTAGGSSGGGAAAVAAGLGPLAEGSDGAGSVRIPASCCGVFGMKPSLGRIPQTLALSRFATHIHHGPLTRTVEDAALMMSVVEGFHASDPLSLPPSGIEWLAELEKDVRGWRVGWSPDLGFAHVDPEIRDICATAVRAFEDLGCVVEESCPKWSDPEEAMWKGLWVPGYAAANDLLDTTSLDGVIDAELIALLREGATQPALATARAEAFRMQMWDTLGEWFGSYDLLVCPTLCVEPFEVGRFAPAHLDGQPLSRRVLGWLLTYPFNMMSAVPAASVPCGFTAAGLPVGLQIVGRPRGDGAVLRAAANFERARPWASRRPDPRSTPG
jgi:aspartyl-tRNA(Asn)/glutamyl-tRNA(Gln) amidotransferase subunit A